MELIDRFVGCLLGTALGDSLLLPAEGLTRSRIAKRFTGPLRQRLVFGRGMVSDDTEHTFLTAQALLVSGEDHERFSRELAARLRWWLLALPGGCGKATALGLIRSWLGIHPSRSGIQSAGNGPAMRAAVIGLRWADDPVRLRSFIDASTTITHRDERALVAALAVAIAASAIVRDEDANRICERWKDLSPDPGWTSVVDILRKHLAEQATVDALAIALGCPQYVSGYAYSSVPIALYAWLRHRGDPEICLASILRCGGDTDTMGAIAGALLGADGGADVFPAAWSARMVDWPLSTTRLHQAGQALGRSGTASIHWCWPMLPLRNLFFLLVVLAHGFRRLLP